jgi:hypothetical protein
MWLRLATVRGNQIDDAVCESVLPNLKRVREVSDGDHLNRMMLGEAVTHTHANLTSLASISSNVGGIPNVIK